jgi:hypothetical protein
VDNWKWKLASPEILKEAGEKLKELTLLYGR